jgi:hypothetical protein
MSPSGAESAYRGYRLQALYALWRLLCREDARHLTFQPEGREDLAVFDGSASLQEAAQVKAHGDNLTISTFFPEGPAAQKATSFFHRAVALRKTEPQAAIKIISFGPIGPEMLRAWGEGSNERCSVAHKLSDYGIQSADADALFQAVQIQKVDESILRNDVFAFLGESLVGGDPENAFDLLNYWLYTASEQRERITYGSLIARINSVGRYLAERTTHPQEWFTSILPVEDRLIPDDERAELDQEFYQGLAARYEHILAGADVVRDSKLCQIEAAFREQRVVIIHGASGQGKSTLAYRFLHDFVPAQWRFMVRLIQGRRHALAIARALAGHAAAVGAPMMIYVDVSPRDQDWPDLVHELAQDRNLQILVTIREEDLRHAPVAGTDFQFASIELSLDEAEGSRLYQQLAARKRSSTFLTFEDAWRRFGSGGPLLEFVYLVAQNQSLQERLQQQINRLRDDVREGRLLAGELELLRLVSVASAYEARLDLPRVVEELNLPEPQRTLQLFEREYLLRRSPDGRYIEGLHPIRSAILADLLTDPVLAPWPNAAQRCLRLIDERDLETFLLYAFSRHQAESPALLKALAPLQPGTWTGMAGVLRALLWLGVREYVARNQGLVNEAFRRFGPGWALALDFDLAGISVPTATRWWENFSSMPDQTRAFIQDLCRQQEPKETAFLQAKKWISESDKPPSPLTHLTDWDGLAEVVYWIGQLHADSPVPSWIAEGCLRGALDELPLSHLGNLVLGLSYGWGDWFQTWLEGNRAQLLTRFCQETRTVAIEDDGQTIRAHFIVDLEHPVSERPVGPILSDPQSSRFHNEALWRVDLLRKIIQDRQQYGCQGYGHRLGALHIPVDDTEKTGIPLYRLPPAWGVTINALFRKLGAYAFRPSTWQEYAVAVLELRRLALDNLTQLAGALAVYFRKQKSVGLLGTYIDLDKWIQRGLAIGNPPLLPQCAVDEWGFMDEGNPQRPEEAEMGALTPGATGLPADRDLVGRVEVAFNLWPYRDYLATLREYTTSLSWFHDQAVHILTLNPLLREVKPAARQIVRQKASEQGIKVDNDWRSTENFARAVKALPRFQEEFRRHFAHLFAESVLSQIEERERYTLPRVWSLWYQFAFNPTPVWADPENEAFSRFEGIRIRMRRRMEVLFQRLAKKQGIQARILSEDTPWEEHPALWVVFDIPDPINVYKALESTLKAVREALGPLGASELKRHVLGFYWPKVVLLSLIRGRSLSQVAWSISTIVLLNRESLTGDDWWNFVPREIPQDTWSRLGLRQWEHPGLDLVNQFQGTVTALSLLIARICDFTRLPELDEQGRGVLESYVESQRDTISKAFQQVLDRMRQLADQFNSLPAEEQQRRPSLLAAARTLVGMRDNILPCAGFDGTLCLDLAGAKEWLQRLEAARAQAEEVRLHWTADVLDFLIETR